MHWLYYSILLLYLLLVNNVYAKNCESLIPYVKEAHEKVINNKYPWWYGVSLLKTETNCKWIKSLDGHGSIGYAQLTPKFLDPLLRPLFPNYDKEYSVDHFYAVAYIIGLELKRSCRLWQAYQAYNGGQLVYKECKRANNSCLHEECKKQCKRKEVCVYMTNTGCKQYRSACDINYTYSIKIYNNAKKFKPINSIDYYQYW